MSSVLRKMMFRCTRLTELADMRPEKAHLGREAGGDALAQQEQRPQRARRHVDGQPAVDHHPERGLLGVPVPLLLAPILPVAPAQRPQAACLRERSRKAAVLQDGIPAAGTAIMLIT